MNALTLGCVTTHKKKYNGKTIKQWNEKSSSPVGNSVSFQKGQILPDLTSREGIVSALGVSPFLNSNNRFPRKYKHDCNEQLKTAVNWAYVMVENHPFFYTKSDKNDEAPYESKETNLQIFSSGRRDVLPLYTVQQTPPWSRVWSMCVESVKRHWVGGDGQVRPRISVK